MRLDEGAAGTDQPGIDITAGKRAFNDWLQRITDNNRLPSNAGRPADNFGLVIFKKFYPVLLWYILPLLISAYLPLSSAALRAARTHQSCALATSSSLWL